MQLQSSKGKLISHNFTGEQLYDPHFWLPNQIYFSEYTEWRIKLFDWIITFSIKTFAKFSYHSRYSHKSRMDSEIYVPFISSYRNGQSRWLFADRIDRYSNSWGQGKDYFKFQSNPLMQESNPYFQVKVIQPNIKDEGEICLYSRGVMMGYLGKPQASINTASIGQ